MIRYLIFYCCCAFSLRAIVIVNEQQIQKLDISKKLYVYEEDSQHTTINDIRLYNKWKINNNSTLNLGFSSKIHWLKLEISFQKSIAENWYLVFPWNTIDYIEVHEKNSEEIKLGGDRVLFEKYNVKAHFPAFKLRLMPHQVQIYFIKIKSKSYINIPIYLKSHDVFYEDLIREKVVQTILLIIEALLIGYICFLFYRSRDLVYIFYILYSVTLCLTIYIAYGSAYQYLWPSHPDWQNEAQLFFFSLAFAFGLEFSHRYLRIKEYLPRLISLFYLLILSGLSLAVFSLLKMPQSVLTLGASILYIASTFLILISAVLVLRLNFLPAKPLFWAWSILFGVNLMNVLYHLNILEYNFYVVYIGIFFLPLDFFIFILGFRSRHEFAIENTRKFMNLEQASNLVSNKKSHITNLSIITIEQNLRLLMENEKIFKNEQLDLKTLATRLKMTTHQLSEYLNQVLGTSFSVLVKQYRIEEAKKLLREKNTLRIIDIAFEVGFNSKSSFNASFKEVTKLTPTQFVKLHH